MGRGQRLGQVVEQSPALGDDRPAGIEEGAVPEAQLVARRALLADRAQQAVALLEDAAVRGQVVRVGRRARRRQRVERGPAERRRARDEEHLLRREDDDPQEPGQTGSPGGPRR